MLKGLVLVVLSLCLALPASATLLSLRDAALTSHRLYKRALGNGYGTPHNTYSDYSRGPVRPGMFYGPQAYPSRQNYRKDILECPDFEPFRCPHGKGCISIQYLCDGAPDCPGGHDEKTTLCTAAKRPPVEETASFLNSLLASHGPNYLEKLFGTKARNALKKMGGVRNVAIALSQSQTIDEFGHTLSLEKSDVDHLRSVFMAVENGDIGLLKSLGIKDSELGDVKFFLEKLVNTGFLD
ncbi:Low-density lipoprotein (LDL) receptor class A repeat [Trinorchestia longiramus]|nr:Low-density lipoprotein (LDL) receptor class A repeat [Trinorchestia longiramus]